jgi:DNA-binding LacI/PurR family transcriptional regulator
MVAYNDISAIGAMKAFAEAKLRIPQDVSVGLERTKRTETTISPF